MKRAIAWVLSKLFPLSDGRGCDYASVKDWDKAKATETDANYCGPDGTTWRFRNDL